jgi:hypothetical protein
MEADKINLNGEAHLEADPHINPTIINDQRKWMTTRIQIG